MIQPNKDDWLKVNVSSNSTSDISSNHGSTHLNPANEKSDTSHKKPLFWEASTVIVRKPRQNRSEIDGKKIDEKEKRNIFDYLHDIPSILNTYLSKKSFILKVTSDNGMRVEITTNEPFKKKAQVSANVILQVLRKNFSNLDGKTEVKPVYQESDVFWNKEFCEVELPKLPYRNPAPILENINLISKTAEIPVRFFIIFKPVNQGFSETTYREIQKLRKKGTLDKTNADKLMYKWRESKQYKLRVFFQCKNIVRKVSTEKYRTRTWVGSKEADVVKSFLTNGIINLRDQYATVSLKSGQALRVLFSCSLIKGTVVIPSSVDLHLYHSFPIQNALKEPSDSFISPIMRDPNEIAIPVGKYIQNNVQTNIDTELLINSLRQSMTVFGLSRSGKTGFISNVLIRTHQKCPYVSQIFLALKDETERDKYVYDVLTGYDDPNFKLPWLFISKLRGLDFEAIAQYITSAIGLADNSKRFLIEYLKEFKRKFGKFPRSFEQFLKGFLEFLDRPENRYGKEHGDIYQANKNRIKAIMDSPRFHQVVEGSSQTPQWFKDWINQGMNYGKRIMIDLRKFSKHEKRFIVIAILHMIKTYAIPHEDGKLRRLLVCDEAHIMFYKPKTNESYDADNIGQYKLDEQMDVLINEMANTGTGAIFADQNPIKLLDSIRSQIGTQVCFRISREAAELFTKDTDLINFLHRQPKYICWVESGPASSQFYMKADPPIKDVGDSSEFKNNTEDFTIGNNGNNVPNQGGV